MRTSKAFPGKYRVGFESSEANDFWSDHNSNIPIVSDEHDVPIAEVHEGYPHDDSMESLDAETPLYTAELLAAAPELIDALDAVTASLETCLAHFGKQMTEADRQHRQANVDAARKLIDQHWPDDGKDEE